MNAAKYTHQVQRQDKHGAWHDGYFAYTPREARGVAREGTKRDGRPRRVVPLKTR